MKHYLFAFLCFTLCFTLLACSSEDKESANPLLGTWAIKSPQTESTYRFEKTQSGISGSYEFCSYSDSTWNTCSFTMKEQTETTVTLLMEDGTIDVLSYRVIGNRLYLGGILYYNTAVALPSEECFSRVSLEKDGSYYLLYKDIFMGMHLEDVEQILKTTLTLETDSETSWDYQYAFLCPYFADIMIRNEDFYNVEFGFDRNHRLVHLCKQGKYTEKVMKDLVSQLNTDFGETNASIYQKDCLYYQWNYDGCTMELQIYAPDGASAYFTISYYVCHAD